MSSASFDGRETVPLISRVVWGDVDPLVGKFCFPWATEEKTRERWIGYVEEQEAGKRTVGVVKRGGEIVGYGSLIYRSQYPFLSNTPEISDLWIGEAHRGKGIGSRLIAWLEEVAVEEGFDEVVIGVGLYADYGPAQKLYVKLGYVPDGQGITYNYQPTSPGNQYCLDDDLVFWLRKKLS